MRVLREGSTGDDVVAWQTFLMGRGLYTGVADGAFGPSTKTATQAFQGGQGLVPDGVAGNKTLGMAMALGLPATEDSDVSEESPNWPPAPEGLQPLVSTAERARLFGSFQFVASPTPGNPEAIRVTDNWYAQNVQRVIIPQLAGVTGAPSDGSILFHRKGVERVRALFDAWQQAGLESLVLSWAGSYAPRFIRGSRTVLSNHAFATAFDVNVAWNALGAQPTLVGGKGSVRKLVPIANDLGWFWGGHFAGRPDGMHFELCSVT